MSGGNGGWVYGPNFMTAPECPNVGNLAVYDLKLILLKLLSIYMG